MRYLTENKIHVVPMLLVFGDQPLHDRVDITPTQFYDRLKTSPAMPRTSQPTPADLLAVYRHLASTHNGILSVHLSGALSGTLQSAQAAARQVSSETGVPICVIDSFSASAAEGLVVWTAAEAIRLGMPLDQCVAATERAAQNTDAFIYVPSVEYFVRGGRLSPLQGRIAALLRILPILTVDKGALTLKAKALGRRAARARVLRSALRAAENAKRPMFIVTHSAARNLAHAIRVQILEAYPHAPVWITETAPAIGCHAGPGGFAVAVLDTVASDPSRALEATSAC
jgi:DegV family protein with EDD domain